MTVLKHVVGVAFLLLGLFQTLISIHGFAAVPHDPPPRAATVARLDMSSPPS
jgi:hypothetical protein